MFERITRRQALPAAAIAGGVLFASVPLTPAMGLIGVPDVDVAAADATTDSPADARSPVVVMAAAEGQRQMLAEQQARQQAIALRAARRQAQLLAKSNTGGSLTFNGSTTVQPTTGGAIPTTQVTAKTRQIQSLVKKYFPADQLGNAMAVSACESGHSDAKGAVNSDGTIDWGVFQLNDGGTLQGSLDAIGVSYSSTAEAQKRALDTATNVKAAASIYAERGWGPWVCAYKIGVVSALYSSTPGPMDGKFDAWGKPTVNVPVVTVDPGANNDPSPVDKPNGTKPKPKPTKKPEPKPTAKPTSKPTPSRTPSASPKPTQSQRPTSRPSQTSVPPVSPKPQVSTPAPRVSQTPR